MGKSHQRPIPQVSIIIVCWNSEPYLRRCLASLSSQLYRDFEVIIIDNGSKDISANSLIDRWPALDLHVEQLDTNVGFAKANNMGSRLAKGRWLALLNPDAFPEANWLELLVKSAEEFSENCFFASRQLQAHQPQLLDGEGDIYHVSGLAWRQNYNLPVYELETPGEVFSACGAAALYPRKEFMEAGGFDEDYFAYLEDVDLGFRLRLRGLKCILVPRAVVHHVGSASSGKMSDFVIYHGHRNMIWTFCKDMPDGLFWLYLPLHIAMNLFFVLSFVFQGRGGVILRAKLDALRGLPGIFRRRKGVQRQRQIPIPALHAAMSRNWLEPLRASRLRKKKSKN